jgi:hypothetical protein
VGLFDKARKLFGFGDDEAASSSGEPQAEPRKGTQPAQDPRRAHVRGRRPGARPELPDVTSAPSQTVEDVLAAREAGDADEARRILRDIDRGGGLRTVLRAAAALEADDADELAELLPIVAGDEAPWRLLLQIGAAIALEGRSSTTHIERARAAGAPGWALGWASALSRDEATRRAGLVELLFADPALARTVAARDLAIEGAEADPDASQRYAAFAHGRDSIRRFGVDIVADVIDRALEMA